jgi:predicted Rossmann fold nucleotide-binding protein DprA/Smf involved in DNA uptake
MDAAMFKRELGKLGKIDLIVTGGARGADQLAMAYAKANGIPTKVFYPDYENLGAKRAPLARNVLICAEADIMIAFWDGQSSGTSHAINAMRIQGKEVIIKLGA